MQCGLKRSLDFLSSSPNLLCLPVHRFFFLFGNLLTGARGSVKFGFVYPMKRVEHIVGELSIHFSLYMLHETKLAGMPCSFTTWDAKSGTNQCI